MFYMRNVEEARECWPRRGHGRKVHAFAQNGNWTSRNHLWMGI